MCTLGLYVYGSPGHFCSGLCFESVSTENPVTKRIFSRKSHEIKISKTPTLCFRPRRTDIIMILLSMTYSILYTYRIHTHLYASYTLCVTIPRVLYTYTHSAAHTYYILHIYRYQTRDPLLCSSGYREIRHNRRPSVG